MSKVTLSVPIQLPIPLTKFAALCESFERTIRAGLGDKVPEFRVKGGCKAGPTLLQFDFVISSEDGTVDGLLEYLQEGKL